MWTAALTVTGLGGLWLVARHWQGWILYLINEVLWLAYGLTIRSTPVIVMAVLWFATGTRNLVVQRGLARTQNVPDVQAPVQPVGERDGEVARNVRRLRDDYAWPPRDAAERERYFWRPY